MNELNEKNEKILKNANENDIPIFVFTAKDDLSTDQLENYLIDCIDNGCTPEHITSVVLKLQEFKNWQDVNNDSVKLPD